MALTKTTRTDTKTHKELAIMTAITLAITAIAIVFTSILNTPTPAIAETEATSLSSLASTISDAVTTADATVGRIKQATDGCPVEITYSMVDGQFNATIYLLDEAHQPNANLISRIALQTGSNITVVGTTDYVVAR